MVLRKDRPPNSGCVDHNHSGNSSSNIIGGGNNINIINNITTTINNNSSNINLDMSASSNNEQPVSKRQRIENNLHHITIITGGGTVGSVSTGGGIGETENIENNIKSHHEILPSSSPPSSSGCSTSSSTTGSSNNSLNNSSNKLNNNCPTDETDHAVSVAALALITAAGNVVASSSKSLSSTTLGNSATISPSSSSKTLQSSSVTIPPPLSASSSSSSSSQKPSSLDIVDEDNEMLIFQENLLKQCLCGVSERTLKRPFQSHYYHHPPSVMISVSLHHKNMGSTTSNSTATIGSSLPRLRVATLSEWPTQKLIQFLSNIQLLFEIYLKQNRNGTICVRIKDVCDALIENEHNLFNEIIELSDNSNKYVQYLAGRVMSSFLVIAQDCPSCNDWLKKLVDQLFLFEDLHVRAILRITFSLEIFKRIIEWKDADEHPLEEDSLDGGGGGGGAGVGAVGSSSSAILPNDEPPTYYPPPPIENNYFNFYIDNDYGDNNSGHMEEHNPHFVHRQPLNHHHRNSIIATGGAAASSASATAPTTSSSSSSAAGTIPIITTDPTTDCQQIHLSDYDSMDSTNLKCDTVKNIENKWPALLRKMNTLISSYHQFEYGENLIIIFLELWKSIISVQANLSVNDTHPFHAQLDRFEELHLNHTLAPTIYKQMLTLFNEALCYGSTLSLQDIIPDETRNLAHRIIKHIKDDSSMGLLYAVPTRPTENPVSLIGYLGRSITNSMKSYRYPDDDHDDDVDNGDDHLNHSHHHNHLHHHHHHHQRHHHHSHPHHDNNDGTNRNNSMDLYGAESPPLDDDDEPEQSIDKTFLQKMVLLVLKSVAVTVREMRSDSSDSSIDSNDYQAYSDLIVIEQNMRTVIKKLDIFTKTKLQLHPEHHHFSKMLVYLFDDQDDFLIEAMVCTLDVTAGFTVRTTAFTENPFAEFIRLLNPVYTFLEFLNMTSKSWTLLLDLLVSNETCFLLYLLRFLKYITKDWDWFDESCQRFGELNGIRNVRDDVMNVLQKLRFEISRMVATSTFPYDISPILRLLEMCENLHDGDL